MTHPNWSATDAPVALVTGGARRVGAAICRQLHAQGLRVLVHCGHSVAAAQQLAAELNGQRPDSARVLVADLRDMTAVHTLATSALAQWQRVDVLVNNASSFYPTPVGQATQTQWDDLFASNARAPFFLCQALADTLRRSPQGAVVNLVDIHARYPLAEHTIYNMAKAALVAMTRSLAKELAPAVRVNAVAPGVIAWPEGAGAMSPAQQAEILASVPLAREGGVDAIAETVVFLACGSRYISGQVVAVDGGRSVWG